MTTKKPKSQGSHWFAIRRDLSSGQKAILTVFSFLLPLALWSIVSYTPFIWHPDIKLEISADRDNVTTVFTAGDHLSKTYFPTFVSDVENHNQTILAARKLGEKPTGTGSSIRRANLKNIRQITPVVVNNLWLTKEEAAEDSNLYQIWKQVAEGSLVSRKPTLTDSNLLVIKRNWTLMSERSPTFESKLLPEIPLEKLIPQGRPTNPVYLPAPHEVLKQGFEDFFAEPEGDNPSMWKRYQHSLKIVFLGFLFSCLIGVPVGVLCGTFDFFSRLVEPFVDFFRYMPAPAFSTLLVAVFLAHDAPKIALVFVGTVFQMVLVASNTTRLLDTSLLEAAQTLGAKHITLIRRVILPGITPNLYNDLRILLGWSWTWLVIAELIGVKSGLTEFIETQGRWRNFDSVFPVIILIGITGFVTDQFLGSLRKFLFPWLPESSDKNAGPVYHFITWVIDRKVYETPLNGRNHP